VQNGTVKREKLVLPGHKGLQSGLLASPWCWHCFVLPRGPWLPLGVSVDLTSYNGTYPAWLHAYWCVYL